MAGQQEFVIDVKSDGSVKIEGKGFEGAECKQFSKAIEDALGDVTKVVEKPEYRRQRVAPRTVGH